MSHDLTELLVNSNVDFRVLSPETAKEVRDQWLRTYSTRVLKAKGVPIYRGYMWHGFSYRLEPCLEHEEAKAEYMNRKVESFFIFDEDEEFCFKCTSLSYPDLTELDSDLYVMQQDGKWTMVFTHEQPDIGPFFSSIKMNL